MCYDLIIIGSGPAGVSSALYATSRGLKTLVMEQEKNAGGTLKKVSSITHFTGFFTGESGKTFSDLLDKQLAMCGAEIVQECVTGSSLLKPIKEIYCGIKVYTSKAVIIATGTTQKVPDFSCSEAVRINHLHNFATMEKEQYKDSGVVVIGGSDGAVKETLYLSNYVKKVDLIVLEEKLGAVPEFSKPAEKSEKIEIHLNSSIQAITGNEFVENIELQNSKDNTIQTLDRSHAGIFYYIGSTPNTKEFSEIATENNYIITDGEMKTNIDGVYAAGDVCVKQIRQISTSVSDGAIAAIKTTQYLQSIS